MHIILLSGGSGKRLWPLSNDVRSKQFIRFFPKENGEYESMVERIYRQITSTLPQATVTIATAKSQVSVIHNQLGEKVNVCVEPCRRDTFPAIALASAYLHDVEKVSKDEIVVVCPVDPFVDDSYFVTLGELAKRAENGDAHLVLMGIEPTYPSEKYGYIIPETKQRISRVSTFREKPTAAVAQQYIDQGALWNGGVFAYRLQYVLDKSQKLMGKQSYAELLEDYPALDKISFDYAVVEKEPNIEVVRYGGQWKDLGTWNTLTEAMEERSIGNEVFDEVSSNVHVVNELGIPVLCMGLQNVVVSLSPDGVLVSDKENSAYMKPYVEKIDQQIRFAEKSWGTYRVLDEGTESLTIKAKLMAGHGMDYHSHDLRSEVWTVVEGKGLCTIDGKETSIEVGQTVVLPAGCKHRLFANTDMTVIEVQMGRHISKDDKKKHPLP